MTGKNPSNQRGVQHRMLRKNGRYETAAEFWTPERREAVRRLAQEARDEARQRAVFLGWPPRFHLFRRTQRTA